MWLFPLLLQCYCLKIFARDRGRIKQRPITSSLEASLLLMLLFQDMIEPTVQTMLPRKSPIGFFRFNSCAAVTVVPFGRLLAPVAASSVFGRRRILHLRMRPTRGIDEGTCVSCRGRSNMCREGCAYASGNRRVNVAETALGVMRPVVPSCGRSFLTRYRAVSCAAAPGVNFASVSVVIVVFG